MATAIVTRSCRELVLRLNIPVTDRVDKTRTEGWQKLPAGTSWCNWARFSKANAGHPNWDNSHVTSNPVASSCREMVLHLSIPVSRRNDEEAARGWRKRPRDATWSDGTPCSGTYADLSTHDSSNRSSSQAAVNRSRHNDFEAMESHEEDSERTSGRKSSSSSSESLSYEGDKIPSRRFRWMAPIPEDARRCLLLAIEPYDPAPRQMLRHFIDDSDAESSTDEDSDKPNDKDGVIEDFCVRFSPYLVRKLRMSKLLLLHHARRYLCWLYVKKTLLLRRSRWTNTWTKYLVCRICSPQRELIDRFTRRLEQFEPLFTRRYHYEADLARVTLVHNRTVPENTALRICCQRLHSRDDIFGTMPLWADTFVGNMARKLTVKAIQEDSTMTQLVEIA